MATPKPKPKFDKKSLKPKPPVSREVVNRNAEKYFVTKLSHRMLLAMRMALKADPMASHDKLMDVANRVAGNDVERYPAAVERAGIVALVRMHQEDLKIKCADEMDVRLTEAIMDVVNSDIAANNFPDIRSTARRSWLLYHEYVMRDEPVNVRPSHEDGEDE